MYCCFTGHRPENLPWKCNENDPRCIQLKTALKDVIEKAILDGFNNFYCGMSRGTDMYAAEAVISLKKFYPDIMLIGALPCPQQDALWNNSDRIKYEKLLDKCDEKTIISPYYTDTCMLARNRYMVDNSSRLISVWNGCFRGGTAYTVRYAKKQNKEIYLLRPGDSSISVLD